MSLSRDWLRSKSMAMRVAVLGSGSGGNATVITCAEGNYLIDAGLSAKQLGLRLKLLGVDPDSLDGIFLTHEHSDHARGLNVFLKDRDIPVYVNAMTKEALQWGMTNEIHWKVFQTNHLFDVNGLKVHPFTVPHDAAEPVGYMIENTQAKFGLVTDVGCVTNVMRQSLTGADALFVEANYDEDLLEADTKRPWMTKQRIASKHGHLSNTQAGELIAEVGCSKLSGVILGHLSSHCNEGELAIKTIADLLQNADLPEVKLICAQQNEPTDWVDFGRKNEASLTVAAVANEDLSQGELFNF